MATKGKRPERSGVDVSYTFDKVGKGDRRTGFLAGAVHGVYCHCSGTSKPCVRVLHGERAECAGCAAGMRTAWVGYVPLRRHDGRPFVVCIREATLAVVDRIVPGSRVAWGREEGRGESVWITELATGAEWRHFYPNDPPRADLTSWLLRLWRMPELSGGLVEWFAQECQPAVTQPLPPALHAIPLAEELPDESDQPVGTAHRLTKSLDETTERLRAKQARMRAAEGSKNGSH